MNLPTEKSLTERHFSAILFTATIKATKGATNMRFINVRELKNKTSEVLRMVQERDVIVISRSKPIAIIRHFDEDELEDYVLMNHPDFLAQMERAYQDAKARKTMDIDDYL
jgi:antitoxin (DNA-binding transcriptional repressor) of toxin-antitoxin stability system